MLETMQQMTTDEERRFPWGAARRGPREGGPASASGSAAAKCEDHGPVPSDPVEAPAAPAAPVEFDSFDHGPVPSDRVTPGVVCEDGYAAAVLLAIPSAAPL